MNNLSVLVRQVPKLLGKYSPQILTGIGIVGGITTVMFMHQAAPVAKEEVEKCLADLKKMDPNKKKLSVPEHVSCTWKIYTPTVIMGSISIACVIGGQYILHKRLIAMTAAYTMVAEAATQYQGKVKELIGKNKEELLNADLEKERVEKLSDKDFEMAPCIDGGEDWFMDSLSGRVFKHDLRKIQKAINEFNYQLLNEMSCSVNELYNWIGIDKTDMGEVLWFNIDRGMPDFAYDSIIHQDKPMVVIRPKSLPEARRM